MRTQDCASGCGWRELMLTLVALSAMPWALAAEDGAPSAPQDDGSSAEGSVLEAPEAHYREFDTYVLSEGIPGRSQGNLRFGWWAISRNGDDVKVGEYQDLDPSPFWDVDGIFSDGYRTLDFYANQLDEEANQIGAYFFDPNLTIDFEYQRFLRRWDHDPLTGGAPTSTTQVVSEDLNVGDDYAIRVNELQADFEGPVAENLRWKLRLWGLRKFGDRQANATAHCFNLNFGVGPTDNRCHVLSQRQRIDWLTLEIEPAIEATFDDWTIEYARTMRSFGTSDGFVTRLYNHFGAFGGRGDFETVFPYAFVPDNFTQIDRLTIGGDLTDRKHFYGYLFAGNTRNQFRETDRAFQGFDLRLTDRSIDGLSVTLFGKLQNTDNDLPPFFLPEEDDPDDVRHPINYLRTRAGITSRWQPFWDSACDWDRFSIRSGYEFYEISRSYARYEVDDSPDYVQPDTISHQLEVAPTMRWSDEFETHVRYRARFIRDPLAAVNVNSGSLNTRLPEFENLVEIGGTWSPWPNLLASAQFGIENRLHDSSVAEFDEEDYPLVLTLWYAPTPKLSLTSGYALYTNWIDQDITIGFRDPASAVPLETFTFNYGGRAAVVNFGGRYDWTERVHVSGGVEWVRGRNSFSVPVSTTGADWSLLPDLSDVVVETMRYNAGVDVELHDGVDCFFRYNYFDYEDQEQTFNSGTAHFFLGGLSAVY